MAAIADLAGVDLGVHGETFHEERRRCNWCIWSFEQTIQPLDYTKNMTRADYIGPLPSSVGMEIPGSMAGRGSQHADNGIVRFLPHLESIWSLAAKYIQDTHEQTYDIPLWKKDSDYTRITARMLEFETVFPPEHRSDRTRPDQYSKEEVRNDWGYWTAWLSTQIIYHTIITLLNHPLPVSARFRSNERFPRTFSQATTDLVMLHSNWTGRLLEMMKEMSCEITDPFLGYCVSVAATVYLHFCQSENPSVREMSEASLANAKRVLRSLSARWPVMSQVVSLQDIYKNCIIMQANV